MVSLQSVKLFGAAEVLAANGFYASLFYSKSNAKVILVMGPNSLVCFFINLIKQLQHIGSQT